MRSTSILLGLLAAGCASSGASSGNRPSTVPVYAEAAAAPCPFEVVREVEARVRVPFPPTRADQDSAREQALGREGARAGADAVVLPERTAVATGVMSFPAGQAPSTMELTFRGDAVRFLEACPAAR